MIAPNRFQTQQGKTSRTTAVPARAIGSILDAVLAKYGIEVEDTVTIEMTDKNTTIINASGIIKGSGKKTATPQDYPLLLSAAPENPSASRPKNEKKWQQRFLF